MKRILLLLMFIGFAKINVAQVYQAFPTDSATWRQSSANWNYPDYYQRDYNYYTQGDTIVSSNTYHKIYKTLISSYYVLGSPTGPFNLMSGPTLIDSNKYIGAIREDLSKHVYFLPDTTTTATEILLYDFNLVVGDTLVYSYNNSSYFLGQNVVSGIDSVVVGTQYHKRFKISASGYPNYVSIIEGIGSTFGLLEMFIDPFEWSDNLICFSHNGQSVWADSIGRPPTYIPANCSLPTPVGIIEHSKETQISVFPNPTTGIVNIKTPFSEKTTIEIVNILGKKMLQTTLSSSDSTLNLSHLPKGIYFLQATSGNKITTTQKIVLQ
ncbi:hypothetical protein BH10BAC1_BH10BAC1_13980 [soil metagenome]